MADMDAFAEAQAELAYDMNGLWENFKKQGQAKMNLGEGCVRLAQLEAKWSELLEAHGERIANATPQEKQHAYVKDKTIKLYEEEYIVLKGQFLEWKRLKENPALTSTNPTTAAQNGSGPVTQIMLDESSLMKLPPIKIKNFGGKPEEWVTFRDLFKATVVDNVKYLDVQKLRYLQTLLCDEAAYTIAGIPLTGESFKEAWQTLLSVYDNSRLQLNAHLKNLFNLEKVNKESSAELRTLLSGSKNSMAALKAMGRPVENWDDLLVYLTINKTDKETIRLWETACGEQDTPPTFDALNKFLQIRINTLATIENRAELKTLQTGKKENFNSSFGKNSNSFNKPKAFHSSKPQSPKCKNCELAHWINDCPEFVSKSVDERREFAKTKHLCFKCLESHLFKDCTKKIPCSHCKSIYHHSLLHVNKPSREQKKDGENKEDNSLSVSFCGTKKQSEGEVLLSTVWVYVTGPRGDRILARALLDQCAQSSFISKSLCHRLKLKLNKAAISVTTLGDDANVRCNSITEFQIQPRFESDYKLKVSGYVLSKVSGYKPNNQPFNPSWTHLRKLTLADPHFLHNAKIDLLLSSAVHAQVVENEIRKDAEEKLLVTKTKLGWVISGVLGDPKYSIPTSVHHVAVAEDLNQMLERFWKQEEVYQPAVLSEEEQECEVNFQKTCTRGQDGRYIVRLPFKTSLKKVQLGDSLTPCKAMLKRLEKRFDRDTNLKTAYTDFMSEYEELGHMKKVSDRFILNRVNSYFLPHHGVIKESSTTTKLRTVFNGSFRTDSGYSINDLLHIGSNLLPDLASLVLCWRKHKYAFIADIEKMYRQIRVHEDDQHHQMIVWRAKPDQPISQYKLTTVTYGLNCSPYIANRVRIQLADDEQKNYPLGAQILKKECYLDDILSGADTLPLGIQKQAEVIEICKAGGFNLRKWVANDSSLVNLPDDLLAANAETLLDKQSIFSILGLSWHPITDSFKFLVKIDEMITTWTKRLVSSKIAQIYDPLGWLAPVIIAAKIMLQNLWIKEKVHPNSRNSWDTPLVDPELRTWKKWYDNLKSLEQIRIPRWCGFIEAQAIYELHGFADASKRAYAAVVYLRVIYENKVTINLLVGKTKVAPIEALTIPRLELKAAVLLSELISHQCSLLNIENLKIILWSDSKDVLYWLQGHPARWPKFVQHRCGIIHQLVPNVKWYHVRSADNPADPASRGIMPDSLRDLKLWWEGPSWLQNLKIDLEKHQVDYSSKLNPEAETFVCVVTKNEAVNNVASQKILFYEIIDKYSSYNIMVSVSAYLLRLEDKIIRKLDRLPTAYAQQSWYKLKIEIDEIELYCEEKKRALLVLVFFAQRQMFNNEIKLLNNKKLLPKTCKIRKLNPIVKDGLLRVGGRIQHSLLSYDEKFPLIIDKDHPLTTVIVRNAHYMTLHGGVQLTLSTIRNQFWIINGRQMVKKVIHRCGPCIRYKATPAYQLMGDLPAFRVQASKPFLKTGVDYAGPYMVRMSPGRGAKSHKGYIAVFVCLSTRAVHLEIVSNYTSAAFIAAFRRFTGRRGQCTDLYSDQGSNFVGAAKELKLLFTQGSDFIKSVTAKLKKSKDDKNKTNWHFNPAAAPHCGGIWEAAVKSTKHHLRRVIGDTTLTFEEYYTLLCQIEACLNSRPLYPITDDPTDLQALTPAHFLIQSSSFLLPGPDLRKEKLSPRQRWESLQQMLQDFWGRWSQEYLQTLQKRNKWYTEGHNIKVGELVLMMNEQKSPATWPLARVTKVCPGKDNLVRAVMVRTAQDTYSRPIQKLVQLHLNVNEEEGQ